MNSNNNYNYNNNNNNNNNNNGNGNTSQWMNVEVWGDVARQAEQYVRKGKQVRVEQ